MENTKIGDVIEQLEAMAHQLGIEIFEIQGDLFNKLPTIQLNSPEDDLFVETKEDASLKVGEIIRLAEQLEPKAIFYKSDTNYRNDKMGYNLEISIIHNGINYSETIMSSEYFEIIGEEIEENHEKLRKLRDSIEGIFNNADFDPMTFVETSLLPYLRENSIDYKKESFNLDKALQGWLTKVLKIKNFVSLVDELTQSYIPHKENDEDYNIYRIRIKQRSIEQLIKLVPYMYSEDQYIEKVSMIDKLNELSFEIHKAINEELMKNRDSKYSEKITNSFLDYRKKLGIKNPKVTKQEIEEYLRIVAYDPMIPRELLKNAMYDIANKNQYD